MITRKEVEDLGWTYDRVGTHGNYLVFGKDNWMMGLFKDRVSIVIQDPAKNELYLREAIDVSVRNIEIDNIEDLKILLKLLKLID